MIMSEGMAERHRLPWSCTGTGFWNPAGSSFDVDAANPQVIDSDVIQILHPPI
jgi:hypothetical protein